MNVIPEGLNRGSRWLKAWIPAFAGMTLLFSACKAKLLPRTMGDPAWGLDVTWHGQSCFTLKDSLNRTVVIDPFDETVGHGRVQLRADALLMTHQHFDHNFRKGVKALRKEIDLVESTGTWTVASGMEVTGIPSFHDKEEGNIDGPNTIYVFAMAGMRVAHVGDLGLATLTTAQRAQLGPVDVLFVPVGGVRTLNAAEAKRLVDELQPRFVFPMHYGNIRFYKLDTVEQFTRLFPKDRVRVLKESTVHLRASDEAGQPLIYLLNPTTRNN